jgi:hypothetical protein
MGANSNGVVSNCYSSGPVEGADRRGGLVAYNQGVVIQCFWDTQTSGQTTSAGGTGKTTAEMQTASTFLEDGWDFVDETENGTEDIWKITEGLGYPRLWWEKYSGGTGEPNDPYQIATAEDLMLLGETPEDYDKNFILTADIDLDPNLPGRKVFDRAVIAPDTDPNDTWSEFQGTPFTGVFDCKGHTISHLKITGGGYLGLFGQLDSGAEVKNLGVVDVNVIGSGDNLGALAGWVRDVAIFGCYSTGTVSGNASIGGLVGQNGEVIWIEGRVGRYMKRVGGRIANCYSTCSVTGTATLGGLVGYNYAGTITTCYSAGRVSGNDQVGGLVGSRLDGTEDECFWDIQTSGQTYSAGGVGETTAEMQAGSTFLCWVTQGVWTIDEGKGYPRLSWENAPGQPIGRVYCYGGGNGTEGDPYLIQTAEQLNTIATIDCDRDKHFKLIADIDLSAFDGRDGRPSFNTIGIGSDSSFTGVFDGNGHAISHLTSNTGLFGDVGLGGEVRNLGAVDVNITAQHSAGGLVVYNSGTITQCYSTGAVRSTGSTGGPFLVGGLVASNRGTVTRCYSTVAVSGAGEQSAVGGLVGSNSSMVTHCYSTGVVDGNDVAGGLVGQGGSVMHCYSTSPVHGVSSMGGLIGSGTLLHSVWDMQTSGLSGDAGGVGLTTEEMTDPYMLGLNGFANDPNWVLDAGQDYPRLAWEGTAGNIIPEPIIDWLEGDGTSDSPYRIDTADQLILLSKASILWDRHFIVGADIDLDPSLPNGQVFPRAPIQTFTGFFDGHGHAIRHLSISGRSYLGLFGVLASAGEIKDVGLVDVNITGSGVLVGGLVGSSGGTITDCYSTGAVKGGTSSFVGGLVGENDGTITVSWSTCGVSGGSDVGGLVGIHNGKITMSCSTGTVIGSTLVGGLVGFNVFGDVTDSYSTSTVSGSDAGGLVGWNFGYISKCYSTGAVNGSNVGGLVGLDITGWWEGDCFWDIETSGQATSLFGIGKSTAEMQTAKTFLDAGWDFVDETENGTEDIWWILEGQDYPRLWWEKGDETSP